MQKVERKENNSLVQDYSTLIGQMENQVKTHPIQEEMLERLNQLAQELKENWDGYGAYPIEETAYFHTQEVILALSDEELALWNLFPCPNGTLLLASNNNKASINIGNEEFSYAAFQDDKEPLQGKKLFQRASFLRTFNDIKSYIMEA